MTRRQPYVLDLRNIDNTQLPLVGGKGANLGELSRIRDIRVPAGFCVTTEAYRELIAGNEAFRSLIDQLNALTVNDRTELSAICAKIRQLIEELPIPQAIEDEVTRLLMMPGENKAYAVRSSATAEDLPSASFAGQQDSYLNIRGKEELLKHISRCWASLYTDRAAIYRIRNGFGHRQLSLAVIVQEMVFPEVSGIMFTADPVSSNRKVVSIDASYGLGEALVSGLVTADHYKVREGLIIGKTISAKKLAISASDKGGTVTHDVEPGQQGQQALRDEEILRLEALGRTIEAHFGTPQDIEWCLSGGGFYVVQSRPVTTLFPVPGLPPDQGRGENHVYISVGHQQMMTDPLKPLGLSFHLMITSAPMRKAGGWLFVDVTRQLSSPAAQKALLEAMGQHDPLMKDALVTLVERNDFISVVPDKDDGGQSLMSKSFQGGATLAVPDPDDPSVVAELIRANRESVDRLEQEISTKSGTALFDFIREDIPKLKQFLFDPKSFAVFMAAIHATAWVNEHLHAWLGEKNAADALAQSVPHNITSEMGLALLDVADVVRAYPEVVAYLQQAKDDDFLTELPKHEGGAESRTAIMAYLDRYGMRCAGEIDITRTRWSEKPLLLVPLILAHVKNREPGAAQRKFEQGLDEALEKEQSLLERLKQLPDGDRKAEETKTKIKLIRSFSGYREYPKYGMVSRYRAYKQALMKEAERLVQAKVIREKEDVFYLDFEEFREAVHSKTVDHGLIRQRKEAYKAYEKLQPPRVITSDGEIITGRYLQENLPAGALAGLAVSSGTIEGRARVILNMEEAGLEEGDILVTSFTDPSWTPLFVAIKGLVTEVGGLMTHGAVIAREYGLPAVVGVEQATMLIKDGQRIRVNGTEGYVEIL